MPSALRAPRPPNTGWTDVIAFLRAVLWGPPIVLLALAGVVVWARRFLEH